MTTGPAVLVLTEDGAKDAHDVVVALLKKAFALVAPGYHSHRVRFERFDPLSTHHSLVVANAWKGRGPKGLGGRGKHQYNLQAFFQDLATTLLEDPPRFVVWHVDGDRTWSDRATSENVEKFDSIVVSKVTAALELSPLADEAKQDATTRLLRFIPFYSIEAWLYQNLAEARRIAEQRNDPALLAQLEAWSADRSVLDELLKPKDACSLGPHHNLQLAQAAWPTAEVYELPKSFRAAVDGLRACSTLLDRLERTKVHP